MAITVRLMATMVALLESSQERIGGKDSQRREYKQNHKNWWSKGEQSTALATATGSSLQLGVDTVPVLVGPVSYLLLSKPAKGVEKNFSLLSLLEKILPIYK
ncbi:uncharacterized protein LOC115959350 isoform X2 [Quercus lobata]|uniref:uncharacterized protein LOC115959350 isoform X2 n=1 Tax=Quercus lobata TaxID=97700 RepID=UPI00124513FE|nr:uncharacterized protein LOC115959350 isoform X2 [Quercus lobata]